MKKKKVAIQGIKGSFHEEATNTFFSGEEIDLVCCLTFKETFEAVRGGQADILVVAIENSLAGALLPNYKLISDFGFKIIGEIYLQIRHNLLALEKVDIDQAKYVMSHPMALRQCEDFLEEHPNLKPVESDDTANCAKKIKEKQDRNTLVIASLNAAKQYGLEVLEQGIETHKKNYTRFLVLSQKDGEDETGKSNKSSLCFQVSDTVGALVDVLKRFAEYGLNMTKIQSMPVIGKPNEYKFFVDLEWTDRVKYDNCLTKILSLTKDFNVLGEYQKDKNADKLMKLKK